MLQRSSLTALWPLQAGFADRTARTRPQQAYLALALIVGLVIILCLYLQQASQITSTHYDIIDLHQQQARLQRENSIHLAGYAYDRSIIKMNERARALGYGPARMPARYVLLPEPGPVAAVIAGAATTAPAPSPFLQGP